MNAEHAVETKAQIIHGMPREAYDSIKRTHWSKLKHLAKSGAHYQQALLEQEEDTDAKKLGRVVHLAVLEPEVYLQRCKLWTGGVRRGAKWDAFEAKHSDMEIINDREEEFCLTIQAAVRGNRVASKYLQGGRSEVTILWTHTLPAGGELPLTTIDLKCRLDFLSDFPALVDLKTTKDASPEGFGKECWNYRYDAQAAMYQDAYFAATGQRLPYFLIAAEKGAPHVVQVYRVNDAVLEVGREHYRNLLGTLAYYRYQNRWPGFADDTELDLVLPRWAAPMDEPADGLDFDS